MKENIVKLLGFLNREDYDTSEWGIVGYEVNTREYFGSRFEHIVGNFIYVYWRKDDEHDEEKFLANNSPDYFLAIDDSDYYVYIFKY